MKKGNRTQVGDDIREVFEDNPRVERSVADVARLTGIAPNTVGQHLFNLFEGGVLLRRMAGIARGRKYMYVLAPEKPLNPGDQVWYDDNPGKVQSVFDAGKRVNVQWDSGTVTEVSRSDLLSKPQRIQPKYDVRDMRVVQWADLPVWVKGEVDRGDDALRYGRSCTWLRANEDDETFFAFGPACGKLVAMFGRE